ncbi:MAG TPA: beta-galactosidase [Streptosporangiaceae bacterium]|nr:beta-galactosidase [Streptosporangiaceae bacterium]
MNPARAASVIPVLGELRVARPSQPLTSQWSRLPVELAGSTLLGISFRPLQAREFGLDPGRALAELLPFPFPLLRLAAYWSQIERVAGGFDTAALDEQLDAASQAGKKIILCVGAVKAFGYPEFFVPAHHLPVPLPEGQLIGERTHPALLDAAVGFVTRIVERYRAHPAIAGWQIEHDAVDPLGMEHSWRLAASFVAAEVAAVRAADGSRPIVLNGFLPTSLPVRLQQQWRTRDQGDSLAVAARLADIVGLDFYPRHGLARLGPVTAYLAGSNARWVRSASTRYCGGVAASGRRLMVAEGQGEPWETMTTPPSTPGRAMYSCLPEHVIGNYNSAMRLGRSVPAGLWAYLFWGAEYWLLRKQQGDDSYLKAFGRVLAECRPVT